MKCSVVKLPFSRAAGYTATELVLSIAIVSLSALALGYSILEFQHTERASKTVFTVVSLDTALAEAINDVSSYQDDTTKLALRSGRLPPALVFNLKLHLPDAPSNPVISIHPNETLFLNRSLERCKTYPMGDCGYKIKLNLELHPPAFSYEVGSAFPEAALNVARLDRNEVVIPRMAYRDPFRVACDPRREIGLSGLVSSDRYECLSRPRAACERGALPKALIVKPQTHSLEFDCGRPSKVARCPASYALWKVDTKSLDAGQTKAVQCVRTTESSASPAKQPEPAIRLAGRVCPTGYKSDSVCSLVNVTSQPGHCGRDVAPPVPGQLRFKQTKDTVDCGVELQHQSCGAIWQGLAQLKIKCVLDQPEFANAL